MEALPAEALAGVLLGALVGVADRRVRLRVPAWALVAIAISAAYGLRRDPWLVAVCLGLAVPLSVVLSSLARRHGVTLMLLATAWSSAAAALATPDTEGPLLLAGFLAAVAVVTAGRAPTPTTTLAVLVAVAWALAVAHGAGGRPTSLVGAVGAWAVPVGGVIGGGLPVLVLMALHLPIAPWLARVTGLREAWFDPLIVVALVTGAVVALSAMWSRLRRYTEHRAARSDVGGDDCAGADDDVVADPASG